MNCIKGAYKKNLPKVELFSNAYLEGTEFCNNANT